MPSREALSAPNKDNYKKAITKQAVSLQHVGGHDK